MLFGRRPSRHARCQRRGGLPSAADPIRPASGRQLRGHENLLRSAVVQPGKAPRRAKETSDAGGMPMRTIAQISIVATLLTVGPGPAEADWLSGPIRVMRPDGTVFRIESPSAAAWWKEYRSLQCVSCSGSNQEAMDRAARLLYRVERALGTRLRTGPRYLILPDAMELDWPYAWRFYPSTERTPAYLLTQGGISGASGKPLRWDVWYPATDRMEEMILGGPASSPPPVAGAVTDTSTGPSASPLPWVLAFVLSAFAISGILFRLLRRRLDTR